MRAKAGALAGRGRADPRVAATQVPVLLIHGQNDSNIPVRHSRRIAARNPTVSVWEVPNADHCGAVNAAPQEFRKKLIDWFDSHSSGTEPLPSTS